MSTMENTEPDEEPNVDISEFLNLENSSFDAVEMKYFNQQFSWMLEDGLLADITMNAKGGSVKAHKAVLGSVSWVFRDTFKQEQLTSVVNLPNISIQGVKLFLVLIYVLNGRVAPLEFEKSINEHFDELLEICSEYQVWRLGTTIAAYLKFHITPENCWEYFAQFKLMGDECYIVEWWKYISENYMEVVGSKRLISEMQTDPELVQDFLKERFLRTTPRTRK